MDQALDLPASPADRHPAIPGADADDPAPPSDVSSGDASLADAHVLKEHVSALFAQVLQLPQVEDDADFFELGGDSILAVTLMLQIKQATGQDLPITAIYGAANVAAMTDMLARDVRDAQPAGSCLVLLQPGAGPPLFIAHGLGGTVMELRDMARRIGTEHAVYGIEARGLDGRAEPLTRVEDMARFYLDAIRRVQPSGPYRLAGFSFGGLVALEMAQCLRREEERVAFLALLDTYPHTRFWPLRCRVAAWRRLARFFVSGLLWKRLVSHHATVLRTLSRRESVAYVLDRAWRAVCIPFSIFRSGAFLRRFVDLTGAAAAVELRAPVLLPPVVERVRLAGDEALMSYRPYFYDGEIVFLKAALEVRIPFDAGMLWRSLARRMTVLSVPGDHHGLVRSGAPALAAQIASCLRRLP